MVVTGTKPFLLLVDGKVAPCLENARVMFPPDKTKGEEQAIEVHLTRQGVKVNIVDDEGNLVETLQIDRGDEGPYAECAGAPETNEEALEDVQAALLACLEFGVPLTDLFSYLLSRAGEVAYASGIPRKDFVEACVGVYEQVLVSSVGDTNPQGEA